MKELFDVTPHDSGDGFKVSLITGEVDVPDAGGTYTVSGGCGSGKTESIKSLIRQKHNDGIVYCVDTMSELGKMHQWILANLCIPGSDLTEDDVVAIDSNPTHTGSLNAYRDNPELLMDKKVILLTHVRFWSDLVNYFLIYRPKSEVSTFDGDFAALMARDDLRKYILFDETPTFIQPFFSMSRAFLCNFLEKDANGGWKMKGRDEVEEAYRMFISGTKEDPFPNQAYKINRIKRDVVFNIMPQVMNQWIASRGNDVTIKFNPAYLHQAQTNSHVVIFEGAGDVLFGGSNHFQLLDVKNKYNSRVTFSEMQFGLKRRDDHIGENTYSRFIDSLSRRIRTNWKNGVKTLVVVWKNTGRDAKPTDTGFVGMVSTDLARKGISKDFYSVTYHGSNLTKSTNQFRDYGEIILCGTWNIPNADTAKFREAYGVDTSSNGHILFLYIQTICRIGVRNHDGKPYSVVYTDDYSKLFIDQLDQYFNKNNLVRRNGDSDKVPDWLRVAVEQVKVKRKAILELITLIENYDENIANAIREKRPYTFDISIDELFKLLPRFAKKRRNYNPLVEELKKLAIDMKIV